MPGKDAGHLLALALGILMEVSMKFICNKCGLQGEHIKIKAWNSHDGPFCPKCGAGCPHLMSENAQQVTPPDKLSLRSTGR